MPITAANASSIFIGVTPAPIRDFTSRLLRAAQGRYAKMVNPCCGRFTLAQLALAQGWEPASVECSDIALFTTILGRAVNGEGLADLGLQVTVDGPPSLADVLHPAEWTPERALFALKFLTIGEGSEYDRQFSKEMLHSRDAMLASLAEQTDALCAKLAGIRYECLDMWDHIERHLDDPGVLLLVNPPTFSKGYERLYDTQGRLTWNEPGCRQYDPKTDVARLHELLCSMAGLTLMYKWDELDGIPEHHVVFATRTSPLHKAWLVANKPDVVRQILGIAARPNKPEVFGKPRWRPLSDSDPIRPDAKVEIIRIGQDVARYYRELWLHNLPPSSASRAFICVVDGKAAMVLGTNPQPQSATNAPDTAWGPWGCLHYAISPVSRRRLQRLALACTTTAAFKTMAFPDLPERIGIQSTCFSRNPEVNAYRGIYKLRTREPLDAGRYRLVYEAHFSEKTFDDCFRAWHAKECKRLGSDTL